MITFLRQNLRWLGTGFLLTFASCFGQTWFISLFAGQIKEVHGLSDGGWGSLYTVATLGSAALLFLRGALADTMPLGRLAPAIMLLFAASCIGLALAPGIWAVGLAVFGLRFCGQGMCGHIAMTAVGRWFRANRGRAVSIANLGFSVAEILLPLPVILLAGVIGWRGIWGLAAAALALLAAPALYALLARGRSPQGAVSGEEGSPGLGGRHWTRGEAARHWLLPALVPFILTPGFIGTVVFFHQVHIAEVKGWSLAAMAAAYPVYAMLSIGGNLGAGWFSDRFGPERLLPVLLLPLGFGIILLGPVTSVAGWFVALPLMGLTMGMSTALWGVILPVAYGTRHLGSVRSLVTTIGVLATAIGPGVTGILIDRGIDFPRQCLALGLWCLALVAAGFAINRRFAAEAAAGNN
jgi:MFS family permease